MAVTVRPVARRLLGRGPLRPYRRSDDAGLAAVCLRTAADGEDASGLYARPGLPGDVWALPYVRFEPDLCTVVDDGTRPGRVSGYVLGTSDTLAFELWAERAWWPGVRQRYPVQDQPPGSADERAARRVAEGVRARTEVLDDYPAHLHVDLLPHVQGVGHGRTLLETFFVAAAQAGACGVHLGVSRANDRAVGFYRRLGFQELHADEGTLTMGLRLG